MPLMKNMAWSLILFLTIGTCMRNGESDSYSPFIQRVWDKGEYLLVIPELLKMSPD